MNKIAVIGGSRFTSIKKLSLTHSTTVITPYGEPSAALSYGILGDKEVIYLPRRSDDHAPPHKINYRANIWALREAGVQGIIATASVAGITEAFKEGEVVIPNQIIDYTYGRENTFLGEDVHVDHIRFNEPYSEDLRQIIIHNGRKLNDKIIAEATYGVTQGPRFETIAEINRIERDGCHVVGMTAMPEAALARELEIPYACIALVVRKAAGREGMVETKAAKVKAGEKLVEHLVEEIIMTF